MGIGRWWGISLPPLRPLGDEAKLESQEVLELGHIGISLCTVVLRRSILRGLSLRGNSGHPCRSASVVAPTVLGTCGFVMSFVYDFTVVKKTGHDASCDLPVPPS